MPSSTEPQPAQALKLRQELKDWERAFADAHDGRKPTREEVKRDAKIAAKYKQYSKFRGSTSTSTSTSQSSSSNRPHAPPSASTIPYEDNPFAPSTSFASVSSTSASRASSIKSARSQRHSTDDIFKTPSKPYYNDLYDSPLSTRGRRLFGNRPRDSVGPTPQKMGKILGIFESFVDVETTPTHQRVLRGTPGTGNKRAEERVSASPAATGDPFSTPRKRKARDLSGALGSGSGSECDSPTKQTPKDVLSTPAFLRRNNQFAPAAFLDSPPVPQPLRPPVRGLSTMVAELRKMEDDAHGDEEEAMREIEEEMMGPPPAPLSAGASATEPKKVKPVPADNHNDPDTGLPPPPPGAWADDTLQEELPSGGEKVSAPKWKKKGLKRQHRRVIMRPVGRIAHPNDPNCPPPPPNPEEVELPAAGYDDEDLSDLDAPAVPTAPEPESTDPREAARAKRAKIMAEEVVGKGKETVKKVARKISEKAHANYKRVNIRGSKGAKAGNGGGRFSRKRR